MNNFGRAFEPYGDTQNAVMDGSAKTITISRPSDLDTSVHVAVSGSEAAFVRVDGATPTTSNALPVLSNTFKVLSVPTGSTSVKVIGAAGSTVYVTVGRGV